MTDSVNSQMADCFTAMMEELSSESDRGSVVLAAAWMDDHLTSLLKGFLCAQPGDSSDKLLKVGGPLGDFGVKIELAYRLGLLREPTYKSLHLFRRLRNDFAHLSSKLTFDTPSVKDRASEIFKLNKVLLDAIWNVVSDNKEAKLLIGNAFSEVSSIGALTGTVGVRSMLHMTAALTASGLLFTASEVEQREALT